MADIVAGDEVYDENGVACRVIAATEIMHDRPCYRIEFSDGEEITADAEHLWWTFTLAEREGLARRTETFRKNRRNKRPLRGMGKRPDLAAMNKARVHSVKATPRGGIRSTNEIANTRESHKRGDRNHAVPVCPGIQSTEVALPLDPYVLGAWLGDGTSSQAAITSADPEIVDRITARGHEVWKRASAYGYGIGGLLSSLRTLRLLNNKHIPAEYLRSSFEQRLELLRGLMDTDGTALPSGSCEFYSTNERLAEDVRELLVSLGIKARIGSGRAMLRGKDCGPKFRIKFTTSKEVFHLSRKKERLIKRERGTQRWRMIEKISSIESVPVRCIQVDSERGLFLCGRGMIPTHNSHLFRVAAITWAHMFQGLQIYFFRRELADLMRNHMEGPTSFPALLAPWLKSKYARVNWSGPRTGITLGKSHIHLCHCQHEKDVYGYQGADIHVLVPDELTQFTYFMYQYLRSRVRMPEEFKQRLPVAQRDRFPKVLAGSNPGGIGHNRFKGAFIDPKPPLEIWRVPKSDGGMMRQFIPAKLSDNPSLDEEEYGGKLEGLPEYLKRAMRDGDWNIVAGGMFDDLWNPETENRILIPAFDVPKNWPIDRALDWGSSKPFAVGWFAESNGETVTVGGEKRSFYPGTVIQIGEYYGWNGRENEGCKHSPAECGREIKRMEKEMGIEGRVSPGPADSSIFDVDPKNSRSISDEFASVGVRWEAADKGPGSRKNGAEDMRSRLKESAKSHMEAPGLLFIHDSCPHSKRTIPALPRDSKKTDDVNTEAEDHCLSGDTLIFTDQGWKEVARLIGRSGRVMGHDGRFHAFSHARLTGKDSAVKRLSLSGGETVETTANHMFLLADGTWMPIELLRRGDLLWTINPISGYDALHGESNSHLGQDPRVSGREILPVWEVLPEKWRQIASPRMASQEWRDSKGVGCSSRQRKQIGQPPEQLEASAWAGTSQVARSRAHAGANGVFQEEYPESEGLAPLGRRKEMARCEGQERLGEKSSGSEGLRGLRKSILDLQANHCALLSSQLQNDGIQTEAARVEAVEDAGRRDVYNLEVETVRSFIVAGGIVSHNCYDMVRYRCMWKRGVAQSMPLRLR